MSPGQSNRFWRGPQRTARMVGLRLPMRGFQLLGHSDLSECSSICGSNSVSEAHFSCHVCLHGAHHFMCWSWFTRMRNGLGEFFCRPCRDQIEVRERDCHGHSLDRFPTPPARPFILKAFATSTGSRHCAFPALNFCCHHHHRLCIHLSPSHCTPLIANYLCGAQFTIEPSSNTNLASMFLFFFLCCYARRCCLRCVFFR